MEARNKMVEANVEKPKLEQRVSEPQEYQRNKEDAKSWKTCSDDENQEQPEEERKDQGRNMDARYF